MEMVNVNKNSSADVMKSVEDVTDRAVNAQAEKNLFLGEYKERVIKALTFEEIKEKGIYYEIEKALEDKDVDKMVISRHADFNDIKKYIEIAKQKRVPYKMIDNLVFVGQIALVVVAKDAIVHEAGDEIVVTSKLEKCHLKHLPDIYFEAMESAVCDFHLDIIKKEMPEYAKNYKELTFMDKLFGSKCPICQKLGGKKRG
ncbi:DUF1694 domain-containing protein [uncultured Leptotrichia sp.]|jgi:hypothetical protein|uniref:DUF1694 domain-containing protein n=1 Tax=uncultured Leptotrichia sp. TaxID=159271 RepID=UPI002623EABF|nr:DUF1694 domain-containing protein [uncultured Leptotrichia sp.]